MGNVIVHLIRHEKTEANRSKKYLGWTDESIIAKESVFKVPIKPAIVHGSDLKRCRETAMLYFPQASFLADPNLREINFGEYELRTYEELKNLTTYREWIDQPEIVTPPNGEEFLQFKERVAVSFQQIVSKSGEYTFIVHGGVIRALISLFGPNAQSFREIAVSHRCVYSLFWSDIAKRKEGARCELLSEAPIMEKENM
ncbi:fructose-2,6-bisphosphatase [Lysinibacillus yapensis]|uniref:Fructose-2,6-bisphosphatase n=1 Tax=Ureibacillus yapensis TaxID=2304605 RepID=A0A396SBP1_9BACL|nr:histidine phosphatase family protein [Lysinibacillus yapensis]RHW38542.1 fructose-2,6-bisphosphatase [Lysinibacillus yapensis]